MPSTTAFVPATLPAEFVASGNKLTPLTGLTITTNEPVTSAQLIETVLNINFASDPTLTNQGTITSTDGSGTPVGASNFLEDNVIAAKPGNTVLGLLQFTPPTLKNGQSMEDTLTVITATSLTAGGLIDSNVATIPVTIDIVTAPAISGAVTMQPDGGASLDPFATMMIADADFKNTAADTATITVTDPAGTPTDADGLLTGIGLSKTGVGTYSISNPVSPATLQSVLQNLKFTPVTGTADKTTSFEVDATDTKASLTSKDTNTSVLTMGTGGNGNKSEISTDLTVTDTTTGVQLGTLAPATPIEMPYSGPVAGVTSEYVNITQDNLNITATTPNWFIHSGSGEDAIQVLSGTNVLDGGTGSNFLVDGTGTDTDYVDDRNAPSPIWSTVLNFHSGDNATVFGITQAGFTITTLDNQGAVGSTGLTFNMAKAGQPDARITLAGYSTADLTSGKITMSFGTTTATATLPAADYMLLHAT